MRHFCYGRLLGTYNVCQKMKEDEKFALFVRKSFHRYVMCDWGDVVDQDVEANNRAADDGIGRIIAVYDDPKHDFWTIWITTEWDRSVTTILFPEEY